MKQDKLHFSWLLTTLSEGVQTQKVGLTTSHQLWTEIERIFMSTVEARAMNLLSELQTTKKGALSMNEYLQRMKTVFDNLAAIGEPIAKKQLNQYVLGGLGPEYDAFVATATSRAITYEELRGFLLSHEGRIERYNNLTSNSSLMPSANVATLQNNRNNGQCSQYYRVLLGLNQSQNWYRGGGANRARGRGRGGRNFNSRVHCQICGRPGHIAPACYYRLDQSYLLNIKLASSQSLSAASTDF
ncbi:hypothetical protein QYF36_014806 [Acer negundo]|nr:hypothetical protein QYF36_014806 [Acer negundo]